MQYFKLVQHWLPRNSNISFGFYSARWIFLTLIMLFSCSKKVTVVDLPYETPKAFSLAGSEDRSSKWWTAFEDEGLNALVDTALRSNLTLRGVWYQLQEAESIVRLSGSALKPDIDLQLQSGISRPQPDFVGGENTQLSLRTRYEVDLWGRIRYGMHADQFRMEASRYDYKTAAISLSSQIALAWFRLRAAKYQSDLLDEQIDNNEKVLSLIRVRFSSGQVKGVDILRQRQLIAATRAQKILLESQIQVLENQISVLLGQPPGMSFENATAQLPEVPPLPNTGIPLALINRRPDILSAFNNLQASSREVAVAVSSKYPRLNFSLTGAIRSNTFSDLLQSQAAQLSGGLLMPLFYGGRLNADIDRTEAIKEQQLAQYGQTVLTAFQEVENALIQESKQVENLAVIEQQVDLAERSYQQLRIEYLNGSIEYLDVLVALNQAQQLQRDRVSAKLDLLEFRIALYRALAGGFATPREDLNITQTIN